MAGGEQKTILHLSPVAVVGGCEVNCLRLIEGLAGYSHRVLVFDQRGPMTAKWEAAGAQVEHLDAWHQGNRVFQHALAAWALNQREPLGIFYWSTSRLPYVLQILRGWDVEWAVHLGNPVAGGVVGRARRIFQQFAFAPSPNITLVACSRRVADTHRVAAYFQGFSIKTVYNPVGPAFDRSCAYRDLPAGSGPKVGMVARLDSIKDHVTVIRALAVITRARPDIVLEFAGDGDLREFLVREANRLGVADRVRFLGSVSDVPALISGWDIYVHSTTVAEGMGTAVAEAMTVGLPCVVSDIAVMREVCGEDAAIYAKAGDAVALGHALTRLIDDPAARKVMGLAAQLRARRMFARSQVAKGYLQVIERK